MIKHQNIMLVISAPSGCGKTTLARALLRQDAHLQRSISVTTRPQRPGEINGKDYFFVSREKFADMVTQNMFLEHARVFNHSYGTPKDQTLEAFEAKLDMMYVIDWQGGLRLLQTARKEIVSVFVLPPSIKILQKRLSSRGSDSQDQVRKRLSRACDEMSKCKYYDYIVINDKLELAVSQLHCILRSERLKRERQDVDALLSNLKED
jgi:guanylate kinase